MIQFKPIPDASDALKLSPMMNASEKLFSYIEEHDGIGLTPSKAFKRVLRRMFLTVCSAAALPPLDLVGLAFILRSFVSSDEIKTLSYAITNFGTIGADGEQCSPSELVGHFKGIA